MRWGARLILTIVGVLMSNAHLFASTDGVETREVVLSAEEREWIAQHPVMRVGIQTNWAPFASVSPDGKVTGIDIDLLNVISQRTGLKFELVPQNSWEAIVSNWDKVDMVSSVAQSRLRLQVAEFTREYSTSPLVIVQREGEETFGPEAVLRRKKLALPRRHISTQTITNRIRSASVIFAATQAECFDLVAKKQADATVANLFVASQYLNSHPQAALAISGVFPKADRPLRMAVHRDAEHYPAATILDKGLASISQEELDDIFSKHLLFGLESRTRVSRLEKRAEQVLIVAAIVALLLLAWNFFMRKEIRARRKAETQLREASESTQIFAHSLSHDLRAPLRGIAGFAKALKEDYSEKLDAEGQDYLQRIISSSSRMDDLISDVLAYSRTASSEWPMETVDLDRLVHSLIESFPPDQRQYFQIDSKLPPVRGHPTLLSQCLGNLLSNAIKFIPKERTPEVIIRATEEESEVTVFVEDNGIGIEPKDQKRIFQIFERAAPAAYKGTGVGLAVVAKAAERMGDTVGVQSTPGEGSRFWIKLAAADRHETMQPAKRSHPFWHVFAPMRQT